MSLIRVLVVDDQTLVRQGICSLVELLEGIEVVGEAADGAAGLRQIAVTRPDVVLLDLRMPEFDGLYLLERLDPGAGAPPALVLTTFDDDEQLLAALGAGARGYLLKDVSLDTLSEAIRSLARGGDFLHPAVSDRLLAAVRQRALRSRDEQRRPSAELLTPRELDVLRLLATGFTNREIAAALFLAEGTVKNHVSAVLLKLGTTDRTKAVLRALHDGILG